MAGTEEHATGPYRASVGTFPEEWGPAPGTPGSETRAAWVKERVEKWGPIQAIDKALAAHAMERSLEYLDHARELERG
ncbi:MAG: hypothetical protein ACRDP9_25860 [Kribbellaceae bacterium]